MKHVRGVFLIFLFLFSSSCQSAAETFMPTQAIVPSTATLQPATQTVETTPTFIPIPAEALAGLIISSPILGGQFEDAGYQPPERFTVNGLGIINSEGKLIKFSDAGLFEGISSSGELIVYQHGFEDEMTDHIDNLYVYNSRTGETTEIVDDLENEGGKTILAWAQDERHFIYYNDYLTVLFEAFGYFGTKQLFLADVTTGQTTLLIKAGYQFDVSPDQTQIAYTTGEILDSKTKTYGGQPLERFGCFQPHIYNLISSSSRSFDVSQLKEKPVCIGYPKWSPDGTKIIWMGYFNDETFRPIVFNLQDNTAIIYGALEQKPESSMLPAKWYFGERYSDPFWMDNSTFWTPSYEVNVETGEISTPREIESPYNPRWNQPLKSLDGSFNVSLNEARDLILLKDPNESLLASFVLDDLYDGPKQEILTSGFFLPGRTQLVGWSPFIPPPETGNN